MTDQPNDPSESATVAVPTPDGTSSGVALSEASTTSFGATGGGVIAGRYTILNLIGRGGMGAVYRARDSELDEIVALKVLKSDIGDAPQLVERFRREVKLARRVTHPNVARTFDIGEHEGTKFLTMEFIQGQSLSDLIVNLGRLPLARVLEIALALCEGLAAAHEVGVVHRDLKPDNVMVAQNGRVVITDFGIARDPVSSSDHSTVGIVGTPAYMAPEQVEARSDIDARADIYALGVMLYELVGGDLPWQGSSPYTLAAARLYAPPPDVRKIRADVPPALAAVIQRCMAKEPAARFSSAREVAEALASASPTLPQGTAKPSPTPTMMPEPAVRDKAVAVLPFRNLGATEDAYVADGLTDDLIDTLSMTPGLRVRPRGAVARFKGMEVDPREIGREIGVEVIVEGSVRKSATNVRLTARLTSVDDGFQLWAQRFDRPANDLLVVSDETARAIADALTLHAKKEKRVAPSDAGAVDLYLRARAELRMLWPPHIDYAITFLQQAHERAPEDTDILALYARACARAWFFGASDDSETAKMARDLSDRALAAAPGHPEALLAMANVRLMQGNVLETAKCCKRALLAAPDNPDARELAARLLLETSGPSVAIPQLESALALDPTLGNARIDLMRAHALAGDVRTAIAMLEADQDPERISRDAVLRARLATWYPETGTELEIAIPEDAPIMSPWFLVRIGKLIRQGKNVDAELAEAEAFTQAANRSRRLVALFQQLFAEYRASLGQFDHALAHIARSVEGGLFDLAWLDLCPVFTPIRGSPEFVALRDIVAVRAKAVADALA